MNTENGAELAMAFHVFSKFIETLAISYVKGAKIMVAYFPTRDAVISLSNRKFETVAMEYVRLRSHNLDIFRAHRLKHMFFPLKLIKSHTSTLSDKKVHKKTNKKIF